MLRSSVKISGSENKENVGKRKPSVLLSVKKRELVTGSSDGGRESVENPNTFE